MAGKAKAQAAVESSSAALPPPPVPPYGVVEELQFDGLYALHGKLCSREVPECQKTFNHRDFRAHVLNLVKSKQLSKA